MNKPSILKQMILAGFFIFPLVSLFAAEAKETDYDPNLLIFAGHIRNYVEQAKSLKAIGEDRSEAREAIVQQLNETGRKLGRIYFSQPAQLIQTEINKHLQAAIKENEALKNYFVFMGNAFAEEAARLVRDYHAHQKNIKTWSTLGGAAIGLAIGGTYIVVKLKSAIFLNKGFSTKDLLIAGGIVGAGTAIGFGVGTSYASKLPVDNSVKNAATFAAKYPHGEDFVNGLDSASDLALRLSELR